jgi:hypothetical protein
MKRILNFVLILGATAWIAACSTAVDDSNQQQKDATGGLVGTWISAGQDVAPLFKVLLNTDSIVSNFNAQGGYSVTSYSAMNGITTFTGNYTVAKSSKDTLGSAIYTIDLRQATPSVVRAQGIYHVQTTVSPARMLYEVVQSEPPAGTFPTPTTGFGSSKDVAGRNLAALGLSNVQVFRKR